jgi:hypothetical protein
MALGWEGDILINFRMAVTRPSQTKTRCHAERSEASAFVLRSVRVGGRSSTMRELSYKTHRCRPDHWEISEAVSKIDV